MSAPAGSAGTTLDRRLALLLAMAMFVLVVDTSLMNVSISAVVRDLGTTVSGVQSAIALEALVSAAFILIGSKVGDWTFETVVSRSSTTAEIETFMSEVSTTSTNIAIASRSGSRLLGAASLTASRRRPRRPRG